MTDIHDPDTEYEQITINMIIYGDHIEASPQEAADAFERRFNAFVEWAAGLQSVDTLSYTEPTEGDLRIQADVTTSLPEGIPEQAGGDESELSRIGTFASEAAATITRNIHIHGADVDSPWDHGEDQ